MGASAGYGQAVHNSKCAMHKLGIQVLPSPDMMAIMGAKDALCKVAMLSIGSEDMLAYYTAHEFASGFKQSLAFQLRGIKQNRGSSCEGIWTTKRQPGSSCTSHDVMAFMDSKEMLCSGRVANIGLKDTPVQFSIIRGVCEWLQEVAGIPAARHQAEQMLVRTDTLCKVAMLHIGLEDMLAHFTVAFDLMTPVAEK
ncbi:unnamed protein product, partial [Symbiodinium sp. KB8]